MGGPRLLWSGGGGTWTGGSGGWERRDWVERRCGRGAGGRGRDGRARSVAAVGALAVIVIGAAPMAVAAANRTADPILALAIAGGSATLDEPAPGFALTDQNGATVTLASLRGKVVLMTFLDPVCTSDCPIIGQEFKQAGVMLGAKDPDVELVAIVANPTYRAVAFTRAFDQQEGLNTVGNWLYLTGSLSELGKVWEPTGSPCRTCPPARCPRTTTWPWSSTGRGTSAMSCLPTPGPAPPAPSPRSPCCSASTPARRWPARDLADGAWLARLPVLGAGVALARAWRGAGRRALRSPVPA